MPEGLVCLKKYFCFLRFSLSQFVIQLNQKRIQKEVFPVKWLIKRQTGLYYSLAYSLFSVKNRYADKSWYDDKNNLRNTFSGTLGIKFRKFHSLAFRVFAAEGRPYSLAVTDSLGRLQYDKSLGYYTERLDPLCSMNVRYSFNISRHWGNLTGYLEVWNFLNYTPVVERNKGYREYYETNTNGLIPILGFSVDF